MSKAFIILDMPNNCIDCPCHFAGMSTVVCEVNKKKLLTDDIETYKPDWCPLRELPEKIGIEEAVKMTRNGCISDVINSYNSCIDELLKGEEHIK